MGERQQEYVIGGIPVVFPHQAYESQLDYMGKVIKTLQNSRFQGGHANALLESPTGSGKTLALLCATLAWQQHFQGNLAINSDPRLSIFASAGRGGSGDEDCFVVGGGFLPAPTAQDGVLPAHISEKRRVPKIIYTTRTHSQISQVLKEFRKTSYRVPMTVLAARKHYCTNKSVRKRKNYDEDCKLLRKAEEQVKVADGSPENGLNTKQGCPEFRNVNQVTNHPSLKKGGAREVFDIEDLVGVGQKVRGCPYYASRAMAADAQILFCPYTYIINPLIRRAMDIDITGAIVIMDEAHNIEDVAREAGSISYDFSELEALKTELATLMLGADGRTEELYGPLLDMFEGLVGWILDKGNNLRREADYSSWWGGKQAFLALQSAGLRVQQFSEILRCAHKAIRVASDSDPKYLPLGPRAANVLEGLFCVLNFMLAEGARRIVDYQLVLRKTTPDAVKHQAVGKASAERVLSFSLWCLSPAVVFEEVACKSQSILLTSGTLSPMESFASELGMAFPISLEAPHVVDMDFQVWAGAIAVGPQGEKLNASYKNANGDAFQKELGASLLEIFKVIPDGVLVFFSSYSLLEKLITRWKFTGQWRKLKSEKKLFVEPQGSQESFEKVLSGYYGAVNNGKIHSGAAFLAVFRGKVSEGLNFADQNARAVVAVGIPFPSLTDLQVKLKKNYNNEYKVLRKLLSGDEWYCQQAFRALNQAVGRCIRHRSDFGAIILLDERLQQDRNLKYMSKWLRKSVRRVENFNNSLTDLRKFFENMEIRKPKAVANAMSELKPHHSFDGQSPLSHAAAKNDGWRRKRLAESATAKKEKKGRTCAELSSCCSPQRSASHQAGMTASPSNNDDLVDAQPTAMAETMIYNHTARKQPCNEASLSALQDVGIGYSTSWEHVNLSDTHNPGPVSSQHFNDAVPPRCHLQDSQSSEQKLDEHKPFWSKTGSQPSMNPGKAKLMLRKIV